MLIASVMTLAACSGSGTGTESQKTQTESQSQPSEIEEAAYNPEGSLADPGEKEETVHVKADPSGNPEEITVTTVLKNFKSSDYLRDVTSLVNIKNSKGDEEFYLQDPYLMWDNHGEEITYEATTNQNLPVGVKVTYYLDGNPVSPQEIAGRTGDIRIRFDYVNSTSRTVTIKDSDGNQSKAASIVPFAAITAVALDEEIFSDVEVENGRLISMDGMQAAVGMAFPGLQDALRLDRLELMKDEDIDFPSFVEIRAHAEGFALDFTATIFSGGLFKEMETDRLDDLDDLVESMDELKDASKEIVDGAADLYDGSREFSAYLKRFTDAISQISDGAESLSGGLDQINRQTGTLTRGAAGLQKGLETLDQSLSSLDLSQMSSGGMGKAEQEKVLGAMTAFAADAQVLQTELETLSAAMDQIAVFARDAAVYAGTVTAVIQAADQTLAELDTGAMEDQMILLARNQAEEAAREAIERALAAEEKRLDAMLVNDEDTGSDTGSGAGSDQGAGAGSDAGSDEGADTDSAAGAGITQAQKDQILSDMRECLEAEFDASFEHI
ncbi:MAG: hypothetical protein II627_02975 [Lachnospiraceae bacterium]|nr:hypothetical protein [Lachnospiraceae bacterium]